MKEFKSYFYFIYFSSIKHNPTIELIVGKSSISKILHEKKDTIAMVCQVLNFRIYLQAEVYLPVVE